jgi:hypothetical protein
MAAWFPRLDAALPSNAAAGDAAMVINLRRLLPFHRNE